ncbi:hypothetical protein SLS63_009300 [Diaporthe eres]|uniref:Uncharacterized protein n=1 Tax=Diaporthe eres TaxID=83184 RepID=A0ABR1P023_DIAER
MWGLLLAPAAHAATHQMIIGTFSTSFLYTVEFDDTTNSLTLLKNTTTPYASQWIALSGDKKNLYGNTDSGVMDVVSYTIADDKGTELIYNTTTAIGACKALAVHVEANPMAPSAVYGVTYKDTCGGVASVDNTGVVVETEQNFTYPGAASSLHGIGFHPTGSYLYTADMGEDAVWTHALDATTGEVTLVGNSTYSGGDPRHINVHPSGRYAYSITEHTSEVLLLSVDNSTGLATFVDGAAYSIIAENATGSHRGETARVSATGTVLYATTRKNYTDDTSTQGFVSGFTLDGSTGELLSQDFIVPTTTGGGSTSGASNMVVPTLYDDDYFAILDHGEVGFVEMWKRSEDGTSAEVVAHLDLDDDVVVMKTFLNMALSGLVDKLYEVAPSLNDSKISGSNSNTTEEQKPGVDDHVIRYILREFLVWKADTETLARASQTSNIDKFVRHSTTDELEEYIKLFEVLGRPGTLHFLRDAVYDYLLPDGSPSTVTILGASISTDTAGRRMTVERWDILHSYFWNLVEWWNVEQVCSSFEDVVLVKRLVALRRYDDHEGGEANWFRPEDDVSQEMKKMTTGSFITRTRSSKDKDDLPNVPWSVEWSVHDILADVGTIQVVKDRKAFTDFHVIMIIDRLPGKKFTILQETAEALKMVAGDRTFREIVNGVIDESMPAPEREVWKAALPDDPYSAVVDSGAASPHYEGYRVRQWDIAERFPDFAHNQAKLPQTYSDVRFIRKVLSEMESQNAITLLETFEAPQSMPTLYQSIDGRQDLFFSYRPKPSVDRDSNQFKAAEVNVPVESLYDFARSYLNSHPEAVFAKGRINVHYCAWPAKVPDRVESPPNFETAEGHIYRWNCIPFDHPYSTQMWQMCLHRVFNQRLPFVRCVHTTFVVCAESPDKADDNLRALTQEAARNDLTLSVKPVALWLGDIELLGLERLWKGVPPDIR